MALLAVVAVAIGAAVTSALLIVSRDVGYQLTGELRALGPNLIVTAADPMGPSPLAGGEGGDARDAGAAATRERYLDEREVRARLAEAGVDGVPVLYALATVRGHPVNVAGTDLDHLRRLHPSWKVAPGPHASLMGIRLMRRLGVEPGEPLTLEYANGGHAKVAVGAVVEAGGAADEAWWIPLADLQALTDLPGRASVAEARVEGVPSAIEHAVGTLERGGDMRAVVLHALSATEADLLDRTRRLMAMVTVAVLFAALLCAFGTLTDLALERRREVALLKALGASRRDLVRMFGVESTAVGLLGGVSGWIAGVVLAQLIGREVFHAGVRVQWSALPLVLALSLLVANAAALGPIRFALGVEPAAVLKGE